MDLRSEFSPLLLPPPLLLDIVAIGRVEEEAVILDRNL